MADSLVLFEHRLVRLQINVAVSGGAAGVEKPLCLTQIFLVASHRIELHKSHLGNLVSGNHSPLPRAVTDLAAYTVGIPYGNIEQRAFSGSLPMGYGTLYQMAEIIELVREHLHLVPSPPFCPVVRAFGVLGACGEEVAVRFLSLGHDGYHTVDIRFELSIGICAQAVGGSLDSLVDIGVVERKSRRVIFGLRIGRADKVFISARLLALGKCERNGDIAARLHARSPESSFDSH